MKDREREKELTKEGRENGSAGKGEREGRENRRVVRIASGCMHRRGVGRGGGHGVR